MYFFHIKKFSGILNKDYAAFDFKSFPCKKKISRESKNCFFVCKKQLQRYKDYPHSIY